MSAKQFKTSNCKANSTYSRCGSYSGHMPFLTSVPTSRGLEPTQPSHPPRAGATSTGDGLGHRWGRKGEFCI